MRPFSKFAVMLVIAASGSVAADAIKTPLDPGSMRNAVEAAVPEGVTTLRVTVFDDNVHVLATATSPSQIAGFIRSLDGIDGLETPDLEFDHALVSGGTIFSMVIPSS